MATVSMAKVGATHYSRTNAKVPYVVEKVIDFAAAVTQNGAPLAEDDIIEALFLPAGTQVLFAGLQVKEAMAGTAADLALDLGVTGNDPDRFVDGFDFDSAAVGAYAPAAAAAVTPTLLVGAGAGDTIDILIETMTGTLTGGKLRVFAVVVDVTEVPEGTIAQVGS